MKENCGVDATALGSLLAAEHAFGEKARRSIREAFLEYLAEDSVVLEPLPVPGRAFYSAMAGNSDQLSWYPTSADVSGSGDLGFTSGPWIYTPAAGGATLHGEFLSIWKRGAGCRWQVEVDGGVSHGAPAKADPVASPDEAASPTRDAPPPSLAADDTAPEASRAFQDACGQDGFAAALRTYARTKDFLLCMGGEMPMGLAAANRHLAAGAHPVLGTWRETARAKSSDSSILYTVGLLGGASQSSSYAYVQIWQWGARVANWGLRVLLINRAAPAAHAE